METELELTYLVKSIPKEVAGVSPSHLLDIYIPDTPGHAHLRLRRQDDHCEITKKTPIKDGDASAQVEQTIGLSEDEFEALAIASQKRVAKDRYKMQIDGSKAELDVFTGKLAGLVLIDFEFIRLTPRRRLLRLILSWRMSLKKTSSPAVCWPARVMKISPPSWLDLAISACICSLIKPPRIG